jgi:SHS2 domain-containing protein
MKKFEILEHIADLKIKAFGKNLKDLFLNATLGMYKGAGYKGEGEKIKREIEISSIDLPALLVDFLSEVLYLTETEQEVYQKIKFQECAEKKIKAVLIGQKLKKIETQIKGVTYHDLEIKRVDNRWQAVVLFDV